MSVFTVQEPYDSVVRILNKLVFKSLKEHGNTGVLDAANEIMELVAPNNKIEDLNK